MRFRYNLRFVLLLPCLVAAFCGGWTAHDYELRRVHQMQDAVARQRRDAMLNEMAREWDAASARRQEYLDQVQEALDQIEHRNRMERFRSRINAPTNSRMFPGHS